MQYSVTHHNTYNRVFFYNLNKAVCLATDVVITMAMLAKLEQAIKAKG
jgi:hypothetical protein